MDSSETLLLQSDNPERLPLLSIFIFTTVVSGDFSQDVVIIQSEAKPAFKSWQPEQLCGRAVPSVVSQQINDKAVNGFQISL